MLGAHQPLDRTVPDGRSRVFDGAARVRWGARWRSRGAVGEPEALAVGRFLSFHLDLISAHLLEVLVGLIPLVESLTRSEDCILRQAVLAAGTLRALLAGLLGAVVLLHDITDEARREGLDDGAHRRQSTNLPVGRCLLLLLLLFVEDYGLGAKLDVLDCPVFLADRCLVESVDLQVTALRPKLAELRVWSERARPPTRLQHATVVAAREDRHFALVHVSGVSRHACPMPVKIIVLSYVVAANESLPPLQWVPSLEELRVALAGHVARLEAERTHYLTLFLHFHQSVLSVGVCCFLIWSVGSCAQKLRIQTGMAFLFK